VRVPRLLLALAASAFAGAALPTAGQAADASPLVPEATIALDRVSGRIDHMAIDLARRRLIVAELGNGSVDIIDLAAAKVLHRIAGLKAPQGVASTADRIAVASADDGTVRFFAADDFSPAGMIALGEDADNIRTETRSGRIVVGYGGGALAVIEPSTATIVSTARLAGHPEGFQIAPDAGRIFVNVPDARQIAVVDGTLAAQVATWTTPDLRANFPMAIDKAGTTVASVFRRPARLVLFDTAAGAVTTNVVACGDADDVFFDAARRRIYVSCGEGIIDVFQQDGATPRRIAQIPTSSGARTSLFVPELDRLFVAARAGQLGSSAAIIVFRPQP
jgi:DNA-binding beta-propeller fold protein YncE